MIGIGKYSGMDDLIGVSKDYDNIFHTFYKQFGYSIILKDEDNNLLYCNKNNDKISKLTKRNYKLHWKYDEIEDFVDGVARVASDSTNEHDGLLFFISSHGESDSVILDSECEEISLIQIFYPFFGEKSPYLLDKPKIFVVDACRGSMRAKPIQSPKTDKSKAEAKMEHDDGEKNGDPDFGKSNKSVNSHDNDSNDEKMQDSQNKDFVFRGNVNDGDDNNNKNNIKLGNQYYHSQANTRFIYSNPDGYAAVDAGSKGGYLIQSTKKIFCNQPAIYDCSLDNIVNQIRAKTRDLVGNGVMQNVQDVNHMNFDVFFKPQQM